MNAEMNAGARGRCALMLAVCAVAALGEAPVFADSFLSVRDNTGVTLGGVPLLDGDVARYDAGSGAASIYLSESAFESGSIDLNALHVRTSGSVVFSTLFNGGIGGLVFGDGDVVEYDPATGGATVLLPESAWGGITTATDVNALFVRDDGNIILSHNNDLDMLGGLQFSDGDVVEYDPVAGAASMLLSESQLFDDANGDVDAVHLLPTGRYVLSFAEDEMVSGVAFFDGDLVEYDPATDTASLYMGESVFGSLDASNDTNAFSMTTIPAPGVLSLVGLAFGVGRRRRRRERGHTAR